MGPIGRTLRALWFVALPFIFPIFFTVASYAVSPDEGTVVSGPEIMAVEPPPGAAQAEAPVQLAVVYVPPSESPASDVVVEGTISDPLEHVNRGFFKFNDRFYFWVLKPVSSGYRSVVPEDARIGVRNFFSNVTTPVRLVNCLLQADFKCGGGEALRFVINTTVGLAGFLDPAKKDFHLEKENRDFGQTLGIYGIGFGIYINWPILGPSSVRDTFGYVGDLFLDPRTYFISPFYISVGVGAYEIVNETSLTIGEYEDLKESALDPYTALKDAYFQYRLNKIRRR